MYLQYHLNTKKVIVIKKKKKPLFYFQYTKYLIQSWLPYFVTTSNKAVFKKEILQIVHTFE